MRYLLLLGLPALLALLQLWRRRNWLLAAACGVFMLGLPALAIAWLCQLPGREESCLAERAYLPAYLSLGALLGAPLLYLGAEALAWLGRAWRRRRA